MSFTILSNGPHRCELPTVAAKGTLVRCDECGLVWKRVADICPGGLAWARSAGSYFLPRRRVYR